MSIKFVIVATCLSLMLCAGESEFIFSSAKIQSPKLLRYVGWLNANGFEVDKIEFQEYGKEELRFIASQEIQVHTGNAI